MQTDLRFNNKLSTYEKSIGLIVFVFSHINYFKSKNIIAHKLSKKEFLFFLMHYLWAVFSKINKII